MNRQPPPARAFTTDRLHAALTEAGSSPDPGYLDEIVARARHTRQRPAWTYPERLLPMSIAVRREAMPRAALLIAVLLLLVALVATAVVLTGGPVRPPAPLVTTNGLIAFQSGTNIEAVRPDGSDRQVIVQGVADDAAVTFSPDGRRMAYFVPSGSLHELVVADGDGTDPITIGWGVSATTGAPDWSPDGTRIAFSATTTISESQPACAGFGTQNGDFCTSRIFVAPVDGSGARQIGDPTLDARSPAWSPDGSKIAFGGGNATPGLNVRLYLMNGDGTNVHSVGDVRGTDWAFVRNGWSADGSKIVAQASAADNLSEWDIWVIQADGTGATNVGAHPGGDEVLPAWAPDRDALAWFWDGIVLQEPGAMAKDFQGVGTAPVWSPDGKLIASSIEGDKLQVIDMNGRVQFTVQGATGNPSWQRILSGG